MPYSITTKDGITIQNIPDDVAPDAPELKQRVASIRSGGGALEAQPEGFGSKMNTAVDQALRAPGLTARAALQGVGDVVTAVTEPIRLPMSAGLRMAGLRDTPIPNASQMAGSLADTIGLPQPKTPMERVGVKGAELMAGAAIPMAAAERLANAASPTAREVIRQFVSNPGTQFAGAAGSGTAGEYVKETGGNPLSQFIASVGGGLAAGTATNLAGRGVDAIRAAINNFRNPQAANQQIDAVIQQQLGRDVDWQALPTHVKNQLRQDVGDAMQTGNLSPDAVRRLADYRLADAIPNRAGLTLDPIDQTRQRNLSKFGANSNDKTIQAVAQMENENAKRLGTGVQELSGNVVNDRYVNSERALAALKAADDARAAKVTGLYNNARDSLGRAAPLDPRAATEAAGLALAEQQAGGLLPEKARAYLNDIATGKIPFNVDTKEQIVRNLGKMARGASDDESFAIGLVRKALDDAPLLETHGLGPEALAAFRAARTAHAERMRAQDASPALKAAADGMEPDRFFQQFVIGNDKGSVRSLSNLKKEIGADSEGFQALRGQLVAYLKKAGGVDEKAGTFNQSGFNNALDSLGDKKLAVFFGPEELAKLKAIGRVANYEQGQVRGSAVNNSNTGGAVFNLLERLASSSAVTRIPLVGQMPGNIALRIRAGQAQDVPSAIALPAPAKAADAPILSPALAGLLANQPEDRKNKRAKALLE